MHKLIYRQCVLSRAKQLREQMFRIVRTPNRELLVDLHYSQKGRGCYLSKDKDIIIKASKKRLLERNLKVNDCSAIYDELLALLE